MARARRTGRNELKEDKLVETILETYDFLKRNLRLVAIVISAVLVLLIVVGTYMYTRGRAEARASILFGEAMKLFQEAEDAWADQDKMEKANEKYRQAREKFKQILQKYGGSSYADKAAFYVAKSSFQLGEYDQAIKYFHDLADKSRSLFGLYAQQAIGKCYEQRGDLKKAIQEYEESKYEKFKRLPEYELVLAEVILNRAICHERLNQTDLALADYEKLSEMFRTNLQKAIDRKSSEMGMKTRKLLKRLFEESPPGQEVVDLLGKADSLAQAGRNFEALKVYVDALRRYRSEKENQRALSLKSYRQIVRHLESVNDFLNGLKEGDEKLSRGQIVSALNAYERSVEINFAPGRNIAEKAELKIRELKGKARGEISSPLSLPPRRYLLPYTSYISTPQAHQHRSEADL